MLRQPVAVLGEDRAAPNRIANEQADVPAEQQVTVPLLFRRHSLWVENGTCTRIARSCFAGATDTQPLSA